jgi:hypothetical protein
VSDLTQKIIDLVKALAELTTAVIGVWVIYTQIVSKLKKNFFLPG